MRVPVDGWLCAIGKSATGVFGYKLKTNVQPPLIPKERELW